MISGEEHSHPARRRSKFQQWMATLATFATYSSRRFGADGCFAASGALSYTTLVSLVPLAVIAFGTLSAFPIFAKVHDQLLALAFQNLVPSIGEQAAWWFRTFAESAAQTTAIGVAGIAATGVLSVPFFPDVPGRDEFGGESYHTGRWPATPVDFRGKRVAVIGTGSSGVQIVPAIAGDVTSLTVYQRTANWCTPLNNSPITVEEQARLRSDFEELREVLNTSVHGFHHLPSGRAAFDESEEERQSFYERMWNSPGFMKLTSNYTDLLSNPDANVEWCHFIAGKIRDIVSDPATADRLVPKDHRFGEKRPPFVAGYFEAFNRPNVDLVDLTETPIVRVTPAGIETSDGVREFDIIVWATGFDFGTGALARMGIRGRNRRLLTDAWADGPHTFLGLQAHGFPNLFFPGGPHAAAGNNPRYNGDQVDFVMDVLCYARAHGHTVIEVTARSEERWTNMVDRGAASPLSFGEKSYYFGTNIPGKPKRYLLNSAGRPKLFAVIADVVANDYDAFTFSGATEAASATS